MVNDIVRLDLINVIQSLCLIALAIWVYSIERKL